MAFRFGSIIILVWLCSLCVGFGQVSSGPSDELIIPVAVTGTSEDFQFSYTVHHLVSGSFPDQICRDGFSNSGGPLNVANITPASSVCVSSQNLRPELLIPPTYLTFATSGVGLTGIDNGWVRLRVFGSGRLEAVNEITIVDRRKQTVDVFMVSAMRPAREFTTAALWSASAGGSSYAIVNPSERQTATIELSLKVVGSFSCQKQLRIPPLNRVSQFLDQLLSPCVFADEAFGGTLRVTSDVPVAVAALITRLGSTITLPVTRLEADR